MIRILYFLVVVIHAFVHLLGFVRVSKIPFFQSFNPESVISLTPKIESIVALAWLSSGLGLITSLLLFSTKRNLGWLAGAVSIGISQSLIALYWNDAMYGTIANLIILLGGWALYNRQKFEKLVKGEITEMLAAQPTEQAEHITIESISHLPAAVKNWLIRSNVIGTAKVHTIRLKQKGKMRNKQEGKWMAMEAEQFITTDNPGFIWTASIDTGYLMTISGRDKFKDGRGNMLIKAMHIIPIADSVGFEIDQGSMMRYLAEIMWFPAAALNDYISWEFVDNTTARAVLHYKNLSVSGLFSFTPNGDIICFEGKRYAYFNKRYSLETWAVKPTGYKDFNGVKIPNKSDVIWRLETGDFTWLQLEVTELDYNIHAMPTESIAIATTTREPEQHQGKFIQSKI